MAIIIITFMPIVVIKLHGKNKMYHISKICQLIDFDFVLNRLSRTISIENKLECVDLGWENCGPQVSNRVYIS